MPGPLCLLLALALAALANNSFGSTAGQVLELSLDARTAAMGAASLAVPGHLAAWGKNPALLSTLACPEISISFRNEFEDIQSGALDLALPLLPAGVLGAELFSLNTGTLSDGVTAESDWLLSVGYGHDLAALMQWPHALHAGLALKYFRSTLAGAFTGQALAADAGILAGLPVPNMYMALAVNTVGTKIKYAGEAEDLPLRGVVGLSWSENIFPEFGVLASLEAVKGLDSPLTIQSGFELNYQQTVFLRAGYCFLHDTDSFTVGLGAKISFVSFDYAYALNQLSAKHIATVGYRFLSAVPAATPRQPSLWTSQALVYYKEGRLAEAKATLNRALAEDPDDFYAHRYLREFDRIMADWCDQKNQEAAHAEQKDKHVQAASLWNEVLAVNPKDPAARAGLNRQTRQIKGHLDSAQAFMGWQQWPDALWAIQSALNLKPDSEPALALLATLEARWRKALGDNEQANKQASDQSWNLARKGQWEKALSLLNKAVSANPTDPSLAKTRSGILQYAHEVGMQYKSAGQIQLALDLWQRILSFAPDYSPVKTAYQQLKAYYLTQIQSLCGQAQQAYAATHYQEAVSFWEKAYQLSPEPKIADDLANAYKAWGILEYREDRLSSAMACWQASLKFKPNQENVLKYIRRAKNKIQFFKESGLEATP
ncbi:PorV/PorQ family protein [candidate division FCPU426 bacterium]|nr:PorV/PorQ family protein [candidate division FCPU426 bacterium]